MESVVVYLESKHTHTHVGAGLSPNNITTTQNLNASGTAAAHSQDLRMNFNWKWVCGCGWEKEREREGSGRPPTRSPLTPSPAHTYALKPAHMRVSVHSKEVISCPVWISCRDFLLNERSQLFRLDGTILKSDCWKDMARARTVPT